MTKEARLAYNLLPPELPGVRSSSAKYICSNSSTLALLSTGSSLGIRMPNQSSQFLQVGPDQTIKWGQIQSSEIIRLLNMLIADFKAN